MKLSSDDTSFCRTDPEIILISYCYKLHLPLYYLIVSSYPYTMENGLIYISDREAVEELGLSEEYDKLYTKERMDRVVYLREQSDVDIFLGMEKNMQESTAMEIAKLMNLNERMDYNYLREIKERTGIDIEQVAKDLKENDRKPE